MEKGQRRDGSVANRARVANSASGEGWARVSRGLWAWWIRDGTPIIPSEYRLSTMNAA